MKALLGRKLGMTQIFQEGKRIPVTLVEAGPCVVLQRKTKDKDGYEAMQIGWGAIKEKRAKKTEKGKLFRHLREFKLGAEDQVNAGDEIPVSVFAAGDKVRVSGISKGKGFQGAVRRWGFSGRNATHGVKHEQRTLGSVGMSFPERVIKGRKMAGRMGFDRVTVKNLRVAEVHADQNILAIAGAIPGRKGTILELQG